MPWNKQPDQHKDVWQDLEAAKAAKEAHPPSSQWTAVQKFAHDRKKVALERKSGFERILADAQAASAQHGTPLGFHATAAGYNKADHEKCLASIEELTALEEAAEELGHS